MNVAWFWASLPYLIIVYPLFFLGIGLPWAFALLPRADWQDRPTVFALGLALGPVFGTTWLFIMGQVLRSFALVPVCVGLVAIALAGAFIAWRRYRAAPSPRLSIHVPALDSVERLLLVMLALAFVVHIGVALYWPFVLYDTLWTYGYNARVFVTFNHIPDFIEYYPKFLALTYTFGQVVSGTLDDHIARAAIPWVVLGSLSMAYLLGWRIGNKRRVALMTVALWFLSPFVYVWSRHGDLEYAVAMYFIGTTTFFMLAWRSHNLRYAVIAGLLLGGALWAKPTAGAWIIGSVLLLIATGVYLFGLLIFRQRAPKRGDIARNPFQVLWRKFQLLAVVGLVSIPIGSMWYVRNILVGHVPVRFPPGYWVDKAERSGKQLTWLLLLAIAVILVATTAYLRQGKSYRLKGRDLLLAVCGFGLLIAGSVPNALNLGAGFALGDIPIWLTDGRDPAGPLTWPEVVLILTGLGLMVVGLRSLWRRVPVRTGATLLVLSLIIAPYAVAWFMIYSHTARLALPIMPAFALMVALVLDAWLDMLPARQTPWLRYGGQLALAGLCLLGPVILVSYTARNVIVPGRVTDDEKRSVDNAGLLQIRDAINTAYAERITQREDLVMYTFQEFRLAYFYPWMSSIYRWEVPGTFAELERTPDILIGGQPAIDGWEKILRDYPNQISHYMDMGQAYTAEPVKYGRDNTWLPPLSVIAKGVDNHTLHLVAYRYHPDSRELSLDDVKPARVFHEALWGCIALRGLDLRDAADNTLLDQANDVTPASFSVNATQSIYLQLYWQRTEKDCIPDDYSVRLELLDSSGAVIFAEVADRLAEGHLPMSVMLYPDLLPDRHLWILPETLSPGTYDLRIDLLATGGETVGNTLLVPDLLRQEPFEGVGGDHRARLGAGERTTGSRVPPQ